MFVFNKNMLGGLIGAIALNVVHQVAKHYTSDAPEVDKIGEEALTKALKSVHVQPPDSEHLFLVTLGSDLLANAAYYSLIGRGNKKNLLLRGAVLGAAAGIGALTLTKPMGLDDDPVNESTNRQVMTVGWYLLGGLVTALAMKIMNK
jgi:hypothetical protein